MGNFAWVCDLVLLLAINKECDLIWIPNHFVGVKVGSIIWAPDFFSVVSVVRKSSVMECLNDHIGGVASCFQDIDFGWPGSLTRSCGDALKLQEPKCRPKSFSCQNIKMFELEILFSYHGRL